MKHRIVSLSSLSLVAVAAIMTACGGGGGVGTPAVVPPPLTGVLNDAPVKGVCYLAQPSGLHGATDAAGTYNFNAGDAVNFWIDASGAGCTTTAADSTSTTGISLGSVTPTPATNGATLQTFVLSLSGGPQVAETLQALNHGSTSAMDVSGITLADPGTISSINQYIVTNGAPQTPIADVGAFFQSAQALAKIANTPITPALPIVPATFQSDVVAALANTVASGLGTAPTTVTIPANRIVFAVNSGTYTSTPLNGTPSAPIPYTEGHITYFDGNGHGIKIRPMRLTGAAGTTINDYVGTAGSLETAEQLSFTYSVVGNVVSKTTTMKTYTNLDNGNATDATTIKYDDGHGAFYSGVATKNYTLSPAGTIDQVTYTGSNARLTPLTLSMLAGKTVKIAAPGCPGGTSTATFSADGAVATGRDCGNEITEFSASVNVPGILIRKSPLSRGTMNDGSILYVGLDGPSVAAGSSLVFVTENNGFAQSQSANYPQWGRLPILSVQ